MEEHNNIEDMKDNCFIIKCKSVPLSNALMIFELVEYDELEGLASHFNIPIFLSIENNTCYIFLDQSICLTATYQDGKK